MLIFCKFKNDVSYADITYASLSTLQVANTLDNASLSANASMQQLFTLLNSMSTEQAREAIIQLSGAPLDGVTHLSLAQTRTFATNLLSRMSATGGGGIGLASLAFADNGDWGSTFRYLADAGAIGANGFEEPQKVGDTQLWVRAVGRQTLSEATTRTGGVQAGADKHLGELVFGASLGYLKSDMEQSGFNGVTNSAQLGLYGAKDTKEYRLSLNAIGGKYDNKTSRTTPTGSADADFNGIALSSEIKAAYKYPLSHSWSAEPSVGGCIQRYAQENYDESGAMGSNLSIDNAILTNQALTTELKFINKGLFEVAMGYNRESGDINTPLVGRFSAAPTAGSFNIASANRGQDVLTAMVGSDITVAQNTRLFALINGNWRENEDSYSAMAGVKIGF